MPIDSFFDDRSQFNIERWDALQRACNDLPDGCIMEIGCQRCGNLAWLASQRFPDRICYGFDRFDAGMTALGPKDMTESQSYHEGAGGASYESCVQYVREAQQSFGGTEPGLIKGDVKDTFKIAGDLAPIALAIVDLNLYEPTMVALLGVDWAVKQNEDYLSKMDHSYRPPFRGAWHYLAPGGVILVDDVGFPGIDAALAESGLKWTMDGYFAVIRKSV